MRNSIRNIRNWICDRAIDINKTIFYISNWITDIRNWIRDIRKSKWSYQKLYLEISLIAINGIRNRISDASKYDLAYNQNFRINDISNYTNPGYGLSLVDTLWNAGSYRQPLEQEGNPMT